MKPKTDLETDQSTLELHLNETIQLYEKYSIETQAKSNENNNNNNKQDELELIVDSSTTDLFEKFIDKYTGLLKKLTDLKRRSYFQFVNIFQQTTSLFIIKFYDFASKLLNICFTSDQASLSNSLVVVSRTIELLHVLISSQHEDYDDDEYSLMCCDQLSRCFNFTSSLCYLVHTFSSDKLTLLKDEKNYRMAFTVLNKLTLNSRLFIVDYYASDFIRFSIDKL